MNSFQVGALGQFTGLGRGCLPLESESSEDRFGGLAPGQEWGSGRGINAPGRQEGHIGNFQGLESSEEEEA